MADTLEWRLDESPEKKSTCRDQHSAMHRGSNGKLPALPLLGGRRLDGRKLRRGEWEPALTDRISVLLPSGKTKGRSCEATGPSC